jgi:hypothetical protein
MSTIFPGMGPYLEDPLVWPGVHAAMIVYLRDFLQPLLRPRYVASVEVRVYLEGPDRDVIPDVFLRQRPTNGGVALADAEADAPIVLQIPPLEIREAFVALLDRQSNRRVVTVIEVVSPSNKYAGIGRNSYTDKQRAVLDISTHLVEIDLLRGGPHVLCVPESAARRAAEYDYLACINRAGEVRDRYELYPRTLRQRLPRVAVPLAEGDKDVPLDLQAILNQVYEAGSYRASLDYTQPCRPPLRTEDQQWATGLIQGAGPAVT